MPSDLEYKLGDIAHSRKIALPKRLDVRIGRRDVGVLVQIGNIDPVHFSYADAIRQGYGWIREGTSGIKESRPCELKLGSGRLHCDGRTLIAIGEQLVARGMEAKFLAGDAKKQIEVG